MQTYRLRIDGLAIIMTELGIRLYPVNNHLTMNLSDEPIKLITLQSKPVEYRHGQKAPKIFLCPANDLRNDPISRASRRKGDYLPGNSRAHHRTVDSRQESMDY